VRGDTRFFLDRGVGSRIVPDGLRAAGWSVTTMDERYGTEASQGVADTTWIRDAARAGEVVITKDRAIAKRPLEAEAIYYSDARVLAIASAQITGPEQLARLLTNASKIEKLSVRPGPWVFGVYADDVRRLTLRYPA
jgi:hypothetical protein